MSVDDLLPLVVKRLGSEGQLIPGAPLEPGSLSPSRRDAAVQFDHTMSTLALTQLMVDDNLNGVARVARFR